MFQSKEYGKSETEIESMKCSLHASLRCALKHTCPVVAATNTTWLVWGRVSILRASIAMQTLGKSWYRASLHILSATSCDETSRQQNDHVIDISCQENWIPGSEEPSIHDNCFWSQMNPPRLCSFCISYLKFSAHHAAFLTVALPLKIRFRAH